MAFKYIAAAAIFNEFKYRRKHLNTLSSCVNAPKHLPTKILFCYQLFSFYLFLPLENACTFYIFRNTLCLCLGRYGMYFLGRYVVFLNSFQANKGAS